jgi:hypothetical protein
MFATFTDWEFEDIDGAQDTARGMWPMMQAAGATSFKATQTGEKMPGKVISTSAGAIMVDLS